MTTYSKGAPFYNAIYKRGSIKGDVKNIFLPPPGAAVLICDIQPLSPRRRSGVVALNDCISADWHLLQQRRRRSVSETGKPGGCTVSTMDLSEAPGLVLFRVIREGIGISQRLSATGTCAPTGDWDAHPRTRASQEPTDHHQKKITGDGRALHRRRSSGLRF